MRNDFKLLHQVFRTGSNVPITLPANSFTGQLVFNCSNDMVLVGVGAAAQMWQGGGGGTSSTFLPIVHTTVGIYTNNSQFSGRGAVSVITPGMVEPGSGELVRVDVRGAGVVPVRVYFPRSDEPGGAYSIVAHFAAQVDPSAGNPAGTANLHLYWRLLDEDSKGAEAVGGLEWLSSQAVPEVPKVFHG